MNIKSLHSMKYALPVALMFAISGPSYAVDNNLHFTGHLLSKSCTLVVNGGLLAEVHFPVVSNRDLMVAGQSSRVPVVFQLKDCKGPSNYEVKVTLTGTEDSEQAGYLALDTSSAAQGVGIGMEKRTERGLPLTTLPERRSCSTMATITSISMPGYRRKAVVKLLSASSQPL